MSESLSTRQAGVFLFQIRTLLDSLDGVVARARMSNAEKKLGDFWSAGHIIDGVCDIAGTIALFIGCAVFLTQHPSRKQYSPLPVSNGESKSGGNGNGHHSYDRFKSPLIMLCCYGVLVFCSSLTWNYYMDKYSEMLDIHNNTTEDQRVR